MDTTLRKGQQPAMIEQVEYQNQAVVELLSRIEQRLGNLERLLAKPDLGQVLVKGQYCTREVAELTQLFGVKKAAEFTVRRACADGRIPEAVKNDSGHYRLPRGSVLRILEDGIPPEQR